MFALQWISVAAKPIVQAAGVKVIFASLTGDVLLDMLVAALFTMLCYSSLAVVLLVATLASLHVIALPVALGLVLGANLGSGLLGMLSTLRSTPEARRVTLGNFLFKLIGCVLAIPLVGAPRRLDRRHRPRRRARGRAVPPRSSTSSLALLLRVLDRADRARRRAPAARRARRPTIRPSRATSIPSALDTPALAISCAAREAMRIGDVDRADADRHADGADDERPHARAAAAQAWTTSSTSSTRRSSCT